MNVNPVKKKDVSLFIPTVGIDPRITDGREASSVT